MMSSTAEHVGSSHDDKRLPTRHDKTRIEVDQKRRFSVAFGRCPAPVRKALRLNPAQPFHSAQVLLLRRNEYQARAGDASRLIDECTQLLPRRCDLRKVRRGTERSLVGQHLHTLGSAFPVPSPKVFALCFCATGRLLDSAQPAVGVRGNPSVRDPLGSLAIVEQIRPFSTYPPECKSLRHGINKELLHFGKKLLSNRVERGNPAYHLPGMFYSERTECTCRKDLERVSVKQHATWIIRLVTEVVSEGFEPRAKIPFGERRTHLQTKACARPARRHGQALHHGLCRGHKQYRLLMLSKSPQHRASPAGDFVRWLQLIERQNIQSRDDKNIARRFERMNDGTQPLGPILVLSEKDNTVAASLAPFRQQVESHHTQGR